MSTSLKSSCWSHPNLFVLLSRGGHGSDAIRYHIKHQLPGGIEGRAAVHTPGSRQSSGAFLGEGTIRLLRGWLRVVAQTYFSDIGAVDEEASLNAAKHCVLVAVIFPTVGGLGGSALANTSLVAPAIGATLVFPELRLIGATVGVLCGGAAAAGYVACLRFPPTISRFFRDADEDEEQL